MIYLITQTLNGLFSAALLFLIASGLTLTFGVMRIVNIAHGSFYMLGVYVAYTIIARTQSLILGTVTAMLVVAAVGFVMQRVFLRRFGSDPLAQMMMTMGFALVFRDAALMIWGGDPFTLAYPAWLRGSVEAGEVVFPRYRLFVILVAALVGVALWAINERTLIGARLRATVDDPETAAATGINVARLSGLVFAAGAALAAFGGVMGGPILGGYAGAFIYLRWVRKWATGPRLTAAAKTQRPTPAISNWRSIDTKSVHEVNRDEVNRILDKISASGVDSLTLQERTFLSNFVPKDDRLPPVS